MTLNSIILMYLNQVCFTSYHNRGLSKSMTGFKPTVYVLTKTQPPVWTKLNSVTVAKTNTMEPAQSTPVCGRLTSGGIP